MDDRVMKTHYDGKIWQGHVTLCGVGSNTRNTPYLVNLVNILSVTNQVGRAIHTVTGERRLYYFGLLTLRLKIKMPKIRMLSHYSLSLLQQYKKCF
jgi:hypothetical protein